MALLATNRFAGDGTTTSYEFNFVGKYIARPHVKVYQEDNVTKVRTYVSINDSNFLNDTTLRGLPVTPVGSTLVIYRETPKPPLVDFVNGSRFTEYNLDLVARQGLFVAMEAMDAGGSEARQQLLDAIAVVTALVDGATAAVSDASAAALAAVTSATNAEGSATLAQDAKVGAEAARDTLFNDLASTAEGKGGELVAFKQGGTYAVATTVQAKLREFTSVKDFGAVGDGVTDDTAAFQAAAAYFGSGGALAVPNGGVLFVPKGLYKVTGQTLFQRTGVRVLGEGQEATKIIVAADLGDAAVFKFDQTLSYYSMVGVGVENLRIDMAGFTGHGVHMIKPYDGVSLRNLFVEDVADGYNGYRVEPDPDNSADTISQTLLLENCQARHKNATATAPLFYLSNLQESVLTGCKAFGTYEWYGKAACYPFEFVDCRGIVLNGCSSAFASKHGVKITVLTRPSTGFLIANHTFETIDGAVRADGLAGIGDVIGLCVINPRTEGAIANASGTFDLNRVMRSSIDAGVATVNIDAASVANIILSRDTAQVTNAGVATTILGSANQADTRYKIIAGGLNVSNAGTKHIETSNETARLYSSGAISVQADYPFGASQVGVLLAVNRAGTVALSRVEIGAADSGGTGFRMLRVAN